MLFIYPSPVLLFLAFGSVAAVVGAGAIARESNLTAKPLHTRAV